MDWFIPIGKKDNFHQTTKFKILIGVLIFISSASMLLFITDKYYGMNAEFPFLLLAIFAIGLLFLFKFTGSVRIIGHCMIAVVAFFLFKMSLVTGGIFSDDTISLFLIPLISFIIVGFKDGFLWMLGCIIWAIYLHSLVDSTAQIEYFREQTLVFDRNYYLMGSILNIASIFAVFLIFQYQNNKLIKKLKVKQLELEKRNHENAIQKLNLKDAQRKLENSNRELEQYAHVTSHDLKQPIRTINGFAKLLNKHLTKNNKHDERSSEMLEMILKSSDNMYRFVEDLLSYAKLTATEDPSFHKMDLDSVLDNVLLDLKNQIDTNNVTIERNNLPTLEVVPVKINQIFQNIISNAIKFKKKEDELIVKISCEKKGRHWQLIIEDNGIGIEKKYQEKIFAPFEKLHSEKEYSGSGIGLATCKKIVDLHRGQIWVESEIDKGTKFYFTLEEGRSN